MKWSWSYNPCQHKYESLKNGFQKIVSWIEGPADKEIDGKFDEQSRQVSTGGVFGMNMYTPNDIGDRTRQLDDRPYAGWLYKGYQVQAITSKKLKDISKWLNVSSHTLELQVGVIGPLSAQEQVQKFVHKHVTDSKRPVGWDNQIKNTLGLNVVYLYRRNTFLDKAMKRYRLTTHGGASVGNVMNFINVGALIALGNPKNDFPMLTIQPSIINDLASEKANGGREWYLFAGFDYRYILSSIFIEGKGSASHNISLEPSVYDIFAGITFATKKVILNYLIKL